MSAFPDELAVRYLEGAATAEETRSLEELLRADPEARRAFVKLSHMHGLIAELARQPLVTASPASRWRWWAASGAAAAAAALVAALWIASAGEPMPVLSTCDGEVTCTHRDHDRAGAAGALLAAGDRLVLAAGAHATLAWPDGARVTVDPDSDLVVGVPVARLRLDRGAVRAEVSAHDARHPFAIATPDAVATDVGTIFVVRRQAASTRVEVSEGSVMLAAPSGSLTVPAGSRAVASPGKAPRLVVAKAPPAAVMPTAREEWSERAPAHRLESLPPALGAATWRAQRVLRLSVPVPSGPMRPVIHRGEPGKNIGEAPMPDLGPSLRSVAGATALVLIDRMGRRAWELTDPEARRDELLAHALRSLPLDEAERAAPLFGLLCQRDLGGEDAHALAVAVPAAALADGHLSIGDRLLLTPKVERPTDSAAAHLAALLSDYGAIVVAREETPTLFVEPRLPDQEREAAAAALRALAPALRVCRPRADGEDEDF